MNFRLEKDVPPFMLCLCFVAQTSLKKIWLRKQKEKKKKTKAKKQKKNNRRRKEEKCVQLAMYRWKWRQKAGKITRSSS